MEITVQAIKEAYEKTGLKPTAATWFTLENGNGADRKIDCACALSTLYIAQHSEKALRDLYNSESRPHSMAYTLAKELKIDREFLQGFVNGFDGIDQRYEDDTNKWEGYQLGKQAHEAVFLNGSESEGVHIPSNQ